MLRNLSSIALSVFIFSACGAETTNDEEKNYSRLSFHLVHEATRDHLMMQTAIDTGRTPPGTIHLSHKTEAQQFLIYEETEIDQDCLIYVRSGIHPQNSAPVVNFKFDNMCKDLFSQLTSENIGAQFAVVLDGFVLAAPTIRVPITGGVGFIEGGFENEQEARELAKALSSNIRRQKGL